MYCERRNINSDLDRNNVSRLVPAVYTEIEERRRTSKTQALEVCEFRGGALGRDVACWELWKLRRLAKAPAPSCGNQRFAGTLGEALPLSFMLHKLKMHRFAWQRQPNHDVQSANACSLKQPTV